MDIYSEKLEIILRGAGELLREGFFEKERRYTKKGAIDLVTYWDTRIEDHLKLRLLEAFPDHGFIGEESGGQGKERGRFFVVDPIDGTTNFVHGFPFCCISIACLERTEEGERILAGGVYAPILEELYLAAVGEGTRCNGSPITVSTQTALGDSLFVTGFSYERREQKQLLIRILENGVDQTQGVRRTGSAALDLCYVARGVFDIYIESGIHAWDIAAGALLISEAGGRVSLFNGRELDVFAREIVASNGLLHDEARQRLLAGTIAEGEK